MHYDVFLVLYIMATTLLKYIHMYRRGVATIEATEAAASPKKYY